MNHRCALCGREERLTRHHLIPRTRHQSKRARRLYSRDTVQQVVGLCRPCHKHVHTVLSEKDLEREWNTIDKLRSHPDIATFASWIANKPAGLKVRSRSSRRARH